MTNAAPHGLTQGASLALVTSRRTIRLAGEVNEHNYTQIAKALSAELPKLAQHYGRITAIVEHRGISYIIAHQRKDATP